MPYIELLGRGDRLGANITSIISQIIYAHFNKYEIRYNRNFIKSGDDVRFVEFNQNYLNSVFIKTLFDYIDLHNETVNKDEVEIRMFSIHYFEIISKVVLEIKMDLLSYFKKYIFKDIVNFFKLRCDEANYILPYNPNNTTLIHLRLNDVANQNDYDGRLCASEFSKSLNDDKMADNSLDYFVKEKYGNVNCQSPIPFDRIKQCVDTFNSGDSSSEVYVVTNPGENLLNIPYPVLSNHDESYDLFLLCNSNNLILSRSTFSISAMFFSEYENFYIPLWGHIPCFGLDTKFDNNKNIKYFY